RKGIGVGVRVFMRPIASRGWAPYAGLAVLLVSAASLLTQTAATLAAPAPGEWVDAGGLVGWALVEALRLGLGGVGTWLVLLAGVPIGVLFLTQVSYAALARVVSARMARLRRQSAAASARAAAKPPATVGDAAAAIAAVTGTIEEPPPPPVRVGPRRDTPTKSQEEHAW